MAKSSLLDVLYEASKIISNHKTDMDDLDRELDRHQAVKSLKGKIIEGSSYVMTDDRRRKLELTYEERDLKFYTTGLYFTIDTRESLDKLITYLLSVREMMD